jgi:hypothetical protein
MTENYFCFTTGTSYQTRWWEVANRREITRTSIAAFSPDGQWLAMDSYKSLLILDTTTDEVVIRIPYLPYQGRNWPVIVNLKLHPDDLIADACSRLPRNLTRLEWRQYLGDEPYRPTCPNLPVPEE